MTIAVAPYAFYASEAWRRLRYRALKTHGRVCGCCGSRTPPFHVDHIKLCEDCNLGKGAWDTTDWRKGATLRIVESLAARHSDDDDGKTRLKQTIIDLYSEGRMSEPEAIRAIHVHGLAHA